MSPRESPSQFQQARHSRSAHSPPRKLAATQKQISKFLPAYAWNPPTNSKLYRDTLYERKIKEEKTSKEQTSESPLAYRSLMPPNTLQPLSSVVLRRIHFVPDPSLRSRRH